jgi:hypothetical protein
VSEQDDFDRWFAWLRTVAVPPPATGPRRSPTSARGRRTGGWNAVRRSPANTWTTASSWRATTSSSVPAVEAERRADEEERRRSAEAVIERALALPDVPESAAAIPTLREELSCFVPGLEVFFSGHGQWWAHGDAGEPGTAPSWGQLFIDKLARRERALQELRRD